jgi:hypothetical protein
MPHGLGYAKDASMSRNPILDLPLQNVMRSEIALPLQQMMQIYTVGHFISAWRNPKNQRRIEQVFDSPDQARHAFSVCAAWLGGPHMPMIQPDGAWWQNDRPSTDLH